MPILRPLALLVWGEEDEVAYRRGTSLCLVASHNEISTTFIKNKTIKLVVFDTILPADEQVFFYVRVAGRQTCKNIPNLLLLLKVRYTTLSINIVLPKSSLRYLPR